MNPAAVKYKDRLPGGGNLSLHEIPMNSVYTLDPPNVADVSYPDAGGDSPIVEYERLRCEDKQLAKRAKIIDERLMQLEEILPEEYHYPDDPPQ